MSETLIGKPYGIREQFPTEVEEKRKLLYPAAKMARRNPNNKVRLVRDKLYVNGVEQKPSYSAAQSIKQTEQGQRQNQRMGQNLANKYSHANQKHCPSNNTQNTGNNDNSWVFPPRASVRQSVSTPANAQYQVFTSNKFILLV